MLATLGLWRARAAPVVVDVFTVTAGAEGPAPTLTAGGYARAARVVYVAPSVAGRLAEVAVEEGDEVGEGDVVAVIDSRDLEQGAAEARGHCDLAAATLRRLRAGSRLEEIAEACAKVQAVARANERAERDLARSRALYETGLISAQAFDAAKADYLVGQGNLDAARQSLALIEAGPREEDLGAAQAACVAAFDTLDESGVGEPLFIGGMLAAGAGVGALVKTERWERVPAGEARIQIGPVRGGLQVRVALGF